MPASLIVLPGEMLFSIFENLDLAGLRSVCLVCKGLLCPAQTVVFSDVTLYDALRRHPAGSTSLIVFLRTIVNHPELATLFDSLGDYSTQDQRARSPVPARRAIERAARETKVLVSHFEAWKTGFNNGGRDALIALALIALSRVQRLSLVVSSRLPLTWLVFKGAAESSAALACLSSLSLSWLADTNNWLSILLTLPLTQLRPYGRGSEASISLPSYCAPHSLTKLQLGRSCGLSPEGLLEIPTWCARLQNLILHDESASVVTFHAPATLTQMLRKLRHTLRSLAITQFRGFKRPATEPLDLTGLSALSEFRLDVDYYSSVALKRRSFPIECLPRSIETLGLDADARSPASMDRLKLYVMEFSKIRHQFPSFKKLMLSVQIEGGVENDGDGEDVTVNGTTCDCENCDSGYVSDCEVAVWGNFTAWPDYPYATQLLELVPYCTAELVTAYLEDLRSSTDWSLCVHN